MVPNPEVIQYACIARSTTILAHHRASSADPNIETLASQCIAEAPPNHSLFSHTLNHRTYTFLIDSPFLFFAIFDNHHLLKPLQLRFLHRLRSSSRSFLHPHSDHHDLAPLCFQSQFDSIFKDALDFDSGSNDTVSRNLSTDSKGKRSMSTVPLLAKPPAAEGLLLLKKKKRAVEANGGVDGKDCGGTPENKVEVCGGGDEVNGFCSGGRDFSVAVAKGGLVNDRHQKAKHIWKKHVWVVLLLDLFICAVLFVIWLWVCSGFKCMAY